MPAFSTLLWYAVASLTALPVWIVLFILTAPAVYNPYEDEPDDAKYQRKERDRFGRIDKTAAKKKKILRSEKSCTVVVLGDIGRSPRMMYHAISLAKHGARVELVGYLESDIHTALKDNPLIKVRSLSLPPRLIRSPPSFLYPLLAPVKAVHQSINLYRTLAYKARPTKHTLVQNPPSIPTLHIALFVCFIRNSRLTIDWHNLGYSLLALRLSPRSLLLRLAKRYELYLARYADSHLTVSAAMARYLTRTVPLASHNVRVLHDRPSSTFRPFQSSTERSDFLHGLPQTAQFADDILEGRWKLLVSSTSWTADEDFDILLDALIAYCSKADVATFLQKPTNLPKILLLITGKGPRKESYLKRITELNQQRRLVHCVITTAWLPTEDYARLLAAADLGISLHQSSSGLDLPMKVVDMFGAGLPIAGWNKFEAWPELVQEGVNGVGFGSAAKLEAIFLKLLSDDTKVLQALRENVINEGKKSWDTEWDSVAGKLLSVAD